MTSPHTDTTTRRQVIMDDGGRPPGFTTPVDFTGARARSGPITVGQANMRRCVLRDDPSHLNACVIWRLPEGTDLDAVTAAVRTLVLRHESLRTTYPEHPELRQEVAGSGRFSVAVYAASGDPLEDAREIGRRMRDVRFDPPIELPVRIAVVTVDDAPAYAVLVFCHIAVDAAGLSVVGREWADLMAGRPLPEPSATQPVDLALRELAPAGRRRLAASLRYWETVLRTTPQSMFAIAGVGRTDWMHPRLRIRSRSAAAALPAICERTGASAASVVLAAMCALLGRRLDQRTFVVATPAANRFLPELAEYVGTIAQDALTSVPLEAATFDGVVAAARTRALAALRHSWFDYEELAPVIARVERERGSHWARDCVFNDLTGVRLDGLLAPTPVPAEAGAASEQEDPRLEWFLPESMLTRLMLWAVRLEEEVELALWVDPRCLSRPDAEAFGAGIVRLIVAARDHDVDLAELATLVDLPPVDRGPDWRRIDSCWIEPAAVRGLLADVLGDRPHLVTVVPDDDLGHRLECHLGPDLPDLERVHTECLAEMRHRRLSAMAPHRYVVHSQVPDDPADAEAWRRLPVIAEGTGRAPVAVRAAS